MRDVVREVWVGKQKHIEPICAGYLRRVSYKESKCPDCGADARIYVISWYENHGMYREFQRKRSHRVRFSLSSCEKFNLVDDWNHYRTDTIPKGIDRVEVLE